MSQSNIRSIKASEIDLQERVVAIKRVAKVVKGGRRFSFSALVVTGDWSPGVAADVSAAQCELLRKPTRPAELRALMTHLLGEYSVSGA